MKWGMMRIGVVKEGQALQGALNRAGIRIITITRSMDGGVCVCVEVEAVLGGLGGVDGR